MTRHALAVVGLALLVSADAAEGQLSRHRVASPVVQTQGLSLGATTEVAAGLTIAGPGVRGDISTSTGEGAGVDVVYGFTPRIAAFASADVAKQGTDVGNLDGSMGLAHLELGARVYFPSGKRLVPYALGFIGSRGLAARSTGGGISLQMRITGADLGAGAGVLYAFSPHLALDASLNAATGKLGHTKITGDVQQDGTADVNSSTGFRLKVGFNWHP